MEPKRYFFSTITGSLLAIATFVSFNYLMDQYGAFRPEAKSVKVFADERSGKFLLAQNYVPTNFKSFMLGPSLSANIDTKAYPESKIYNASVMGANISEMRILGEQLLKEGVNETVYISLSPYIFKDHGPKTDLMNDNQKYAIYGSTKLLKSYFLRAVRELELLPSKYAKDIINDYGYHNYNLEMGCENSQITIQGKLGEEAKQEFDLNVKALEEFDEFMSLLEANDAKVVLFFSPVPTELYEHEKAAYQAFEQLIQTKIPHGAVVVNFNDPQYRSFNADYDNFIDHGHLSISGQEQVMFELINHSQLYAYEK